jgi:hypothetical protein
LLAGGGVGASHARRVSKRRRGGERHSARAAAPPRPEIQITARGRQNKLKLRCLAMRDPPEQIRSGSAAKKRAASTSAPACSKRAAENSRARRAAAEPLNARLAQQTEVTRRVARAADGRRARRSAGALKQRGREDTRSPDSAVRTSALTCRLKLGAPANFHRSPSTPRHLFLQHECAQCWFSNSARMAAPPARSRAAPDFHWAALFSKILSSQMIKQYRGGPAHRTV